MVRDNRTEYLRAILHQIPFYIPPVMIANLINIGIFAFMMGFIEVGYMLLNFPTAPASGVPQPPGHLLPLLERLLGS